MSDQNLKKRISFLTGISITVSMIVGSGLFGLPGMIIKATSPHEAVLAWLAISIAVLPLISIFSYLGSRYPTSEGIAKYAELLMGPGGYYSTFLIACGSLALGMPAFFLIIGSYIADLLGWSSPIYPTLFALFAIIFSTFLNLLGPEKFGILTKLVVPIVIVFALGFFVYYISFNYHSTTQKLPLFFHTSISFSHLWIATSIAFWAFQGWENLSFGLEEFKDPRSLVPKIYWISYFLILLIYLPFILAVSLAADNGLNVEGISGLSHLLGSGILKIILLLILIFTLLINAISWTFGASRIAYSAAKKKLLPHKLGILSSKQLPQNSLIICAIYYSLVVLIVFSFKVPVTKLFLLTTQGFIILYAIAIFAFIKLSRGIMQRCIAIAGAIICMLLLSGFTWLLVYPLMLAVFGFIKSRLYLNSTQS